MTGLHAGALQTLRDWVAPDESQDGLRRAYVRHLLDHGDGLLVTCLPAHLTTGALVLDEAGERVLLTHHRKGGFWGQFGGHVEADDESLAATSRRTTRAWRPRRCGRAARSPGSTGCGSSPTGRSTWTAMSCPARSAGAASTSTCGTRP